MLEIVLDSLLDTARIVPFLFITYILMEWLEHATSDKMEAWMKESRQFGPLIGGVLGVIPQCGFSAAASSMYSGGIISVGALIAVFLSTSDEMLPILLGEQVPLAMILKILVIKAVAAVAAGFLIDLVVGRVLGKNHRHEHIHDLCEDSHCHCHENEGKKSIFLSAFWHTVQIAGFLFLAALVLNFAVEMIGEDRLAGIILNRPVIGELLAGVIGLIPNCAASVIITKLYLAGAMGHGAMLSGLLVGAGIGVLVLFRTNRNFKKNVQIVAMLYLSGVTIGTILGFLPIF